MSPRSQPSSAPRRRRPARIDIGSTGLGTRDASRDRPVRRAHRRASSTTCPIAAARRCCRICWPARSRRPSSWRAPIARHVKSGKLRALAVANRRREPLLPDVPTMDEAGLADFRATIWFGLFAPRQTPDAILDRLHGAVQAALGRGQDQDDVDRAGRAGRAGEPRRLRPLRRRRHRALEPHRHAPPTSRWSNPMTLRSSRRAGRPARRRHRRPRARVRARFPGAPDELDRAVPARRLERHLRAADRGLRRPAPGRAGGGRESRRRRRHDRRHDRGARQARRLHPAGGQSQPDLRARSSMPNRAST